jgi:hypothetical protein
MITTGTLTCLPTAITMMRNFLIITYSASMASPFSAAAFRDQVRILCGQSAHAVQTTNGYDQTLAWTARWDGFELSVQSDDQERLLRLLAKLVAVEVPLERRGLSLKRSLQPSEQNRRHVTQPMNSFFLAEIRFYPKLLG